MNSAKPVDIVRELSASPVFGILPPAAQTELARVARLYRCRGRTVLHSAGTPATHLYFVVRGRIELTAVSREGEEEAVGSFGTGQWATWLAPFEDRPTERDIHAVDGSLILAFPVEAVRQALAGHPQAYPPLLREISRRFRAILRLQDARALVSREQRIGQLLLLLAQDVGDGPERQVPITRTVLARRVGCSRQTLYEALGRLEAAGLVRLRYGAILLPDPKRLRAFCTP